MIENGGFEEAGTAPGLAAQWASTFVSSLEEWADFDQNPEDSGATTSQEAFERGWTGSDDQAFAAAFVGETIDTQAAIFNVGPAQTPVERFERAWGTGATIFMSELSAQQPATFSGNDQERFEADWGTVALELPSDAVAAVFQGEPYDDLEYGWKDNQLWAFELSAGTAATFDGAESVEDFEETLAPEPFVAVPASNTMTLTQSTLQVLQDGKRVYVENVGGELPSPLAVDTGYFLRDGSGLTFKLASSAGADAVDLTSTGTGVHRLIRDTAVWWSRVMATV